MKLILVTFYLTYQIITESTYNQYEIVLRRYFLFFLYTNSLITSVYFYTTSQFGSAILLLLNSRWWLAVIPAERIIQGQKCGGPEVMSPGSNITRSGHQEVMSRELSMELEVTAPGM